MLPSPPNPVHRIAYLGSPALAVEPLRALVAAGYLVAQVVSRPDKRRGRGSDVVASPVKAAAQELGLPVTSRIEELLELEIDLGVVVAYGALIKAPLLAAIPFVNLHFSLLPRWRGAAPVERAIMAGDPTTGVCLMALEEALDVGGVYRRAETAVDPSENLEGLRGRLVGLGTGLLLDALMNGFGPAEPQNGEPTYAAKVQPEDRRLNFHQTPTAVDRIVRLGRAFSTFRGRRLIVHRARPLPEWSAPKDQDDVAVGGLVGTVVRCSTGGLELVEVQPEGRASQPAAAWRNGNRLEPGEKLGG